MSTLFNFRMKVRIKRLSIMSKIEMWLLLAEVAKGMEKGQWNEFILDFLTTLCMRGGEADQEIQEWVCEMLVGDGREPSCLAWPIRMMGGIAKIFTGKLSGLLPAYKSLDAESKALGLKAAKPDEIQKTKDICNEINKVDIIKKEMNDNSMWEDVLEFLPTSRQALGFEKKKTGIQSRGGDGTQKINVKADAKLKKAETSILIEGMDPQRKRQVR